MICLVGVFLFQALPGPKILDDAYITFRYARNISQGAGFVYNVGEQVQGTSTPLYTLLLAVLAGVFSPDRLPIISFLIAVVCDVFNGILLYRLARKLLNNAVAAFFCTVVFIFHPFRLNVAAGGMETSLFLFFLLAMYDRYFLAGDVMAASFWAALALLTRLDAILAIFPIILHVLWKKPSNWLKSGSLGALYVLPWFLWAAWYFGNPIPQSIIAKKMIYDDMTPWSTIIFILNFLGTGTVGPYEQIAYLVPGLVFFIILFIFCIKRCIRERQLELTIFVIYPIIYFLVMSILHIPIFFIWYFVPLMPGLLLIIFNGLLEFFRFGSKRGNLAGLSLLAFGLIAIPFFLINQVHGWADQRQSEALYGQVCEQIKPSNQPGQTLISSDIGVIGWCMDKTRIIDPVGLITPKSLNFRLDQKQFGLVSPHMITFFAPDTIVSPGIFIQPTAGQPGFMDNYILVQKVTGPFGAGPIYVYQKKRY